MSLSSLSPLELSKVIALLKQKEKIERELAEVVRKIDFYTLPSSNKKEKAPHTKSKKRVKHGKMTEEILKLLHAADSKGIHIKDIAAKLNMNKASVYAWFYGIGKNKAKKVKPATFAKL